MLKDLDHRDSAILKGLAISAIVFHNFFHFVSPAVQNEFDFDPQRFAVFLQTVLHPDLAVQALFSFFGHFGVQIFVFLSAYGLAKSHWDDPAPWGAFMWGRIRKLYPVFALVVIPWFLLTAMHPGPSQSVGQLALDLLLMFLGVSTLLGFGLPPVGPWWFIPFIVQFYALWPLLRKLTKRFGERGMFALAVLSLLFTCVANPLLAPWSINLYLTPIARMPVLCFGIFAARYPVQIKAPLALLSAAALLLGSCSAVLWPLTFPGALFLFLWGYLRLRGSLRRSRFLERLGECSLLIFLLNGIVRDHFVAFAVSPALQLIYACISAVVCFSLAASAQQWFVRSRLDRKNPASPPHEAALASSQAYEVPSELSA